MKKLSFVKHLLPHFIAASVFLIITLFFFSPIFFENKTLSQHDIQEYLGTSKALRDYRDATGKEGLWAGSMFSGMPAYLVSLKWSDGPVIAIKKAMSVFLPNPVANIFLAFVCYYIMLLAFKVRPYLAIAGAVAFGLSAYMIIGVLAGHNARVGAIAFLPLVVAGIHLAFSRKLLLGCVVTAAGLALHLRENHLQMTYYLILLLVVYGIVQFIYAFRAKQISEFLKTVAILIPVAILSLGTFAGQFWAVNEYSRYSVRGPSELVNKTNNKISEGMDNPFSYSYGISEPMTLIIPNFLGGSTSTYFVNDPKSKTYQALASSSDNEMANQLANYSAAYWGIQSLTSPYYAGAIIVFLFVIGLLFAERKYIYWLLPISILGILLSWGDSFSSFNYFLYDYLPGYNKFRSPTFAVLFITFAMPLLGALGLEKLFEKGINKKTKRKLIIAFSVTGGLCFLFALFSGMFSFTRTGESQLPPWFLNALRDDRKEMFVSDCIRSGAFILSIFIMLYFNVNKKISEIGFFAFLIFMITMDIAIVDKRYLTKDNYQRKRGNVAFDMTEADQAILKDKSYYRVYNLQGAFQEARTSYFHNSIGGYHGVKMRRYQDLYDSAITANTNQLITDAQAGSMDFTKYGVLNMLNAKYIVYGAEASKVISNPNANGSAWFVQRVQSVNSPNEELDQVSKVNTREVAVIDNSKFKVQDFKFDSTSQINFIESKPAYLKYESNSTVTGLGVFSEIYYAKGWKATIDGKEVPIIRVDYALRALEIPQGKHTIEFTFEPKPYVIGNKITFASSWVLLVLVVGGLGIAIRKELL